MSKSELWELVTTGKDVTNIENNKVDLHIRNKDPFVIKWHVNESYKINLFWDDGKGHNSIFALELEPDDIKQLINFLKYHGHIEEI